MPNHCYNVVTVIRDNPNAKPARDVVEDNMINSEVANSLDKVFTFKKIVPQPPDLYLGDVGSDAPEHNWYNWNNAHWGTKWDAYDTYYEHDCNNELEATVSFNTAWAPPEPVFHAWSEQLGEDYSIDVECDIEGDSNTYHMVYKNGECIEESEQPRECGECGVPETEHYNEESGDWIECSELEAKKLNADKPVDACPHNNDTSNDCKNCVFGETNHWDGKTCVQR